MQKVKLTHFKVWRTNPDGSPLEGQWGPYVKLSAQFDLPEYAGKWMSCIVKPDHPAINWQVNNFVEIEDIVSKNGNLNFTLPKKSTGGVVATGNAQLLEKIFTAIQGLRTELKAEAEEIKDLVRGLQIVEPSELLKEKEEELPDIPF